MLPPYFTRSTCVSRYYFDIQDGTSQFDDVGTECATLEDVRKQALRVLPEMARDQTIEGNDRLTAQFWQRMRITARSTQPRCRL